MKHTVDISQYAIIEDGFKNNSAITQKLRTAIADLQMWRGQFQEYFDVASHRCYTRALVKTITTSSLALQWDIGSAGHSEEGCDLMVELYVDCLTSELDRADRDFYNQK